MLMKLQHFAKTLIAAGALALIGIAVTPRHGSAASESNPFGTTEMQLKVALGFNIAPVPLNAAGKNHNLVGYGSYLVNAVADCNGCHSAGPDSEYVFGGIPYFGQKPKKVNPATYLAGGNDFGKIAGPNFADIVSRNLTPDKTGRPEGGHTLAQFMRIMRTGVDMDHLHPTCGVGESGNCMPPPFDGDLLQVMPWPQFQDMTDLDLQAIYVYLSTVPCKAGPASGVLHNDC
jgi:hypothetical protein